MPTVNSSSFRAKRNPELIIFTLNEVDEKRVGISWKQLRQLLYLFFGGLTFFLFLKALEVNWQNIVAVRLQAAIKPRNGVLTSNVWLMAQ